MTFTYDPSNGFTNLERVRFWIGDTESAKAKFSDEEITAMLGEYATWQESAVALVRSLIARLSSQTDFKADWLEVKVSQAVAQLRALLASLETQWALGSYAIVVNDVGGVNVYRSDSLLTEEPTYEED